MMLQIDHRESHDVDIFLSDPQWLPFLDPQKHDFRFDVWPTDYEGDGSSFQKFAFKDIGEIDFIVGHAMTSSPTIEATVESETTLLETIPEIIAKKIYHRGSSIKPRDIFDIGRQASSMRIPSSMRYDPIATKFKRHSRRWINSILTL